MNRNRAGSLIRSQVRLVVAMLIVLVGAVPAIALTATPELSLADTPWDSPARSARP